MTKLLSVLHSGEELAELLILGFSPIWFYFFRTLWPKSIPWSCFILTLLPTVWQVWTKVGTRVRLWQLSLVMDANGVQLLCKGEDVTAPL